MAGMPSEAEIQTQWKNAVAFLEDMRAAADGFAAAGGEMDTIAQALEGQFLPTAHMDAVSRARGELSALIDQESALGFLEPVMFEYGNILSADASDGFGGGYTNLDELFRAIYDWFHDNSITIQSRAITYDTTATAGGSNVGDGAMQRLTVDENNYNLEACHVEKKQFKCIADQNSGVEENAETFEFVGESASFDALLRGTFGSGTQARTFIRSRHAGSVAGGSLLSNSSFSTYNASLTPKFSGWDETTATGNIEQDTATTYRSHPGASTDASLKITGTSTVTLKQTLANMRTGRLDFDTPYVFRVMVNRQSSADGTLTIKMGSTSESVTVNTLTNGQWAELIIAPGSDNWPRSFNEDPFDVEITWTGQTTGSLLIDDAIFAPYDLIDGTYWFLRGNDATHTPWLVDDILTFTDTGGAAGTGKLQWWLWVAGLGYLPSSGTPSITDPT